MQILCDVDGVLADFTGHLLDRAEVKSLAREDVTQWDLFALMSPADKVRALSVLTDPDFWRSQPLIPDAREGVEHLRARGEVYFVTAPWWPCREWADVRAGWLREHFGATHKEIVVTEAKHLIAGDILLDDRPETVRTWGRRWPEGRALLFDATYNQGQVGAGLERSSWSVLAPFRERLPRTPGRDRHLEGLGGSASRACLAALYLSDGRYLPDEAKRNGVAFGYCNAEGWLCPRTTATHVGWTVLGQEV